MPAPGSSRRGGIALGASLIGVLAAPLTGSCADAQGAQPRLLGVVSSVVSSTTSSVASPAGLSLPGIKVSLPVSLPGVGVSLPGVGVTVPSVGVTLPGVTVSTPEVHVTTPEVSASGSGVSVSTPGVTVSTPEASAPRSSPPPTSTSPAESPSGASTSTSPTGGGGGGSSSGPPSSTGGDHGNSTAVAASVASTSGAASGSTQAGDSSGKSLAGKGGGGRPRGRTSYSGGGPTHPRGPAAAATVATGGTGSLAHASVGASGRRTVGASGTTRHGTSNPLEAIGRHIPLPIPVPDWSKPIILVLLLLALWFGVRSRVTARRARRLEGQRATLLRDVGAMQAALVPEIPARVGGLVVSVAYRPAEGPAAGGDFYDVFVPERGKVAIILGDVAGHGHRALTQASLMRYTLRAYLQAGLEPRAALALAGRVLADRTMEHYATVAVAVYHAGEGRLTYASAGHPPPIMHGLRTRQPVAICASPPIGWTVPTGRRQTTVSLPLGAVACFYSDGLIEARCKDDLLGEERLDEILAELGPRPDAAKLLARVRAAALATPDDMAACVIVPEMAGIAARAHVEELEADAEALDGGQARRFLEVCQVATAEIEQTLMRAGDIAAVFGTALLRVELEATTATVIAAPPGSGPQTAMSDGRSRPVGQL
jgi:hypothetical protein